MCSKRTIITFGRGFGKFSETKLSTEIKAKSKELEEGNRESTYSFSIYINYYPSKKIYRFYFGPRAEYGITDDENEALRNKYYETADAQCQIFLKEL